MTTPPLPLTAFPQRKATLIGLAERIKTLANECGDTGTAVVLDEFMHRFAATRFLVVVAGDFKSGKSTLVNALVARSVCPVRVTPRTARVTRLCAVERPDTGEEVVVTYLEDRPAERRDLAQVSLDDLVAVKGKETEAVDMVDVFLKPGDTLLRHPLRLVDTPGLGSTNADHSETTRRYMSHADVILFVFTASKPFSDAERAFLLENRSRIDRIVFAVNQIDRAGDEADEVLSYVRHTLQTEVLAEGASIPTLHPVSGSNALAAFQAGDMEALKQSGLPSLVDAIEEHLADRHVTGLVRTIAQQQREVALGLDAQIAMTEAALVSSQASAEALRPKLSVLRGQLKDAANRTLEIKTRIEATRASSVATSSDRVLEIRKRVLTTVQAWLTGCKSEDACKRDLPAVLAKSLTDEVEAIEEDLRSGLATIADRELRALTEIFRHMEGLVRQTFVPTKGIDAAVGGAFGKGAAALSLLEAFSQKVGGPTGGYGAASAALKAALAPSAPVQFLSVTAAVSLIVALFGGPIGWVVAGVASVLATIVGYSRASTWRERVLENVSAKLDEGVLRELADALETSISQAASALAADVDARMAAVSAQFAAVLEEVRRDLDRTQRKEQKERDRVQERRNELSAVLRDMGTFLADAEVAVAEAARGDAA